MYLNQGTRCVFSSKLLLQLRVQFQVKKKPIEFQKKKKKKKEELGIIKYFVFSVQLFLNA